MKGDFIQGTNVCWQWQTPSLLLHAMMGLVCSVTSTFMELSCSVSAHVPQYMLQRLKYEDVVFKSVTQAACSSLLPATTTCTINKVHWCAI